MLRIRNGIMSEFTIVVERTYRSAAQILQRHGASFIVINPSSQRPVSARSHAVKQHYITSKTATQTPEVKVTVEMRKQIRRPKISGTFPYSGWKAVLVTR